MKKVLAIIIVLAMLVLQVPVAVFAANDVESIITDLNKLDSSIKAVLLGKVWDYTVPLLNDAKPVEATDIFTLIKDDTYIQDNIWSRYIDNHSTSGDGKISEATLLKLIEEMLTHKKVVIDIHATFADVIDKDYIKTSLGLLTSAGEGDVLTKLTEKAGPILTSSGNKFTGYPNAGATLVNKLTLPGFDSTGKALLAALVDTQLQALGDSITGYIGDGYISSTSVISLLNLYNLYGVVKKDTTPSSPPSSVIIPSDQGNDNGITVNPTLDATKTAVASIPSSALDTAFKNTVAAADGTKTVTIKLEEVTGAKAYAPVLPASYLSAADNKQKIVVETPLGNLGLPGNMFKASDLGTAKDVKVTLGITDASDVKDETLKAEIGTRPVIELGVTVDGVAKAWDNPDAPVTVSIKYTPTAEELAAGSDFITIYYIDGSGNVNKVPNARYDAATGTVTFSTTHFSKYAVALAHKTFSDLTKTPWAKSYIEVLASKGILEGTSADTFAPQTMITRDEFLGGIVRALGLTASFEENFTDVTTANKFYSEIGIAKELGITSGMGANKFGAGTPITRQDMIVLAAKALASADKLGTAGTDADLAKFTDKAKISSYAKESIATFVKDGIIVGSGNLLNPLGNLTKAEASVVIYKVHKK